MYVCMIMLLGASCIIFSMLLNSVTLWQSLRCPDTTAAIFSYEINADKCKSSPCTAVQ